MRFPYFINKVAPVSGVKSLMDYEVSFTGEIRVDGMTIPIDDGNRHRLRSAYEARNSSELPVLVRWFEGVEPPVAEYLIAILYDRDQMAKEGTPVDADWGIVGCLYTMTPEETPMTPITMLRNALGVEEGGSGVPIDREAYRRAVEFWEANAGWRG